MSSDRFLSHKAFHIALNGTPEYAVDLALDGAGNEATYDAGEGVLLLIQHTSGGAAWLSVALDEADANEPTAKGLNVQPGDKIILMTKEGKGVIRAVDNGVAANLRVFQLI